MNDSAEEGFGDLSRNLPTHYHVLCVYFLFNWCLLYRAHGLFSQKGNQSKLSRSKTARLFCVFRGFQGSPVRSGEELEQPTESSFLLNLPIGEVQHDLQSVRSYVPDVI